MVDRVLQVGQTTEIENYKLKRIERGQRRIKMRKRGREEMKRKRGR
jgi:hypothetical protein